MLLVDRSQCWSRQGDDDRAIADANEAIRLEPTLTWAYLVRSKYWGPQAGLRPGIRGRQHRSQTESQVAHRSTSFARSPGGTPTTSARAVADCDQAVRLDPKDPVIHLIRGIILANKGELGSAFREVVFHPVAAQHAQPGQAPDSHAVRTIARDVSARIAMPGTMVLEEAHRVDHDEYFHSGPHEIVRRIPDGPGGLRVGKRVFPPLIREAQKRRAKQELEAKLLEGLQDPAVKMTRKDWDSIRREARDGLAGEKIRP